MFDFLSCIISFFLICFLVLIIIISIRFFYSIVTVGKSNINCNIEADKQLNSDSREDTQADLYMSAAYPVDDSLMFPEEFDD